MRREPRAYLADAVAACDAIALHLTGIELGTYLETRVIRSADECAALLAELDPRGTD